MTSITGEDLARALPAYETDANLAKALQHKAKVQDIVSKVRSQKLSEADGARLCVDECTKGIDLIKGKGTLGTHEVLNVLSELRERRASFAQLVIIDDLTYQKCSPEKIEEQCRQMFTDATAVIDLAPKHSPPDLVRKARVHRTHAMGYLNNSLKVTGIDREKAIALEDCRLVEADPEADDLTKAVVSRTTAYLGDMVSSTLEMNAIDSIRASFLNKDDLSQVEGLNVGSPGQPKHFVARSYMDKAQPVSMSDGTPKPLPPGVMSVNSILHMSSAQLNSKFGLGAGTFFGEHIFWKKHNGILLGKHKWESTGEMNNDVATLSECWDMRWLFATPEDARNFHKNMLATCRAEQNNGYLDSLSEFSPKASERETLNSSIKDVVVAGNYSKKKPRVGGMAMAMMMADPTAYLQNYTAVFVIDRIVVKLYVIEGFNPTEGSLKRKCLFGEKGLLNVTARCIMEWVKGKRSEFLENGSRGGAVSNKNAAQSLPELGDLTRCAKCGKKRDDLLQCTRCRKAAYCDRDCQVSHYKTHKGPCKKSAAKS